MTSFDNSVSTKKGPAAIGPWILGIEILEKNETNILGGLNNYSEGHIHFKG